MSSDKLVKLKKSDKLRYENNSSVQDIKWWYYETSAKRASEPKKYFYAENILRAARDHGYISDEKYHEVLLAIWHFLYRI